MLNTLKTNLILTRGVLIALFAGLFILAACGGGGSKATPDTSGGPAGPNPCLTNPYGSTCGSSYEDARQDLFNECRDATASRATVDACDNVPDEAIVCLNDPFDSSCDEEDLANTGGVLLSLQNTRVNICRVGNEATDNGQCANALQTRCFATDANPNAFDPLCSKSSVERQTIITKCVDSATLATDADCADARNATDVGVACFQNPWNPDCELLGDFRGTPLATARTNRAAYCADTEATGFVASLCTTAMASVCTDSGASANPFSDLCTATSNTYDDERVDFATNCFTGENNGADCTVTAFEMARTGGETLCGNGDDIPGSNPMDAMCMTTPVTVATCADAPFSTACREVDTFAGARTALLGICTKGVFIDDEAGSCANGGFSMDEATCLQNPFTTGGSADCGMLLTALGDSTTLKTKQDNLIAACTGADADMNALCQEGVATKPVADCLDNPFDMACDATLGTKAQADVARDNFIELCTGDGADGTNMRCEIAGEVVLTDCLRDPFAVGCDTALGATQAMKAQSNVLALCTAEGSDNFATNSICTGIASDGSEGAANGNLKTCLNNPFTVDTMLLGASTTCEMVLGGADALTRVRANLNKLCLGDSPDATICTDELKTSQFCIATADPFNANCDDVAGIDAGARTAFCTANTGDDNCTTDLNTLRTTCSANPFADACLVADSGYADNRERALSVCAMSNDKPNEDDCKLTVSGTTTVTQCQANPFLADCADGVFDTARTASINACAAVEIGNALCTGVEVKAMVAAEGGNDAIDAVTLAHCFANPFLADCADDIFDGRRTASFGACMSVLPDMRDSDPACTGVEIKAMVAAEGGNDAIDAVTLAHCFANPFQSACADGLFDSRRGAVRADCTDGLGATKTAACGRVVGQDASDMDVTVQGCLDDPLNPVCSDETFASVRSERVDLCLNAESTARDTTTECDDVVKAMVPAEGGNDAIEAVTVEDCIDSPFSADCTNAAFDNARLDSYATCEGVSDTDKATNADCMRVVVAAVTGENAADAVTVADCVADPFATGCVIDGFESVRDGICNPSSDSGTVFNTGCTEENYSNIATTRMEAITFCRGNSYGVGCDTAVSGDADAPTVGACASNPFTAGCDAELFDIAEQKVAYCAEGASTIFDENCDDARPEVVAERATAVRTCLADGAAIAAYAAGTGTGTDINPVCMRTVLVRGRTEVKAVAIGDTIGDGPDNMPGTLDDIKATEADVMAGVTGITEVNLGSCVNDPWLPACASIELLDNARFEHTEVCMRDGLADDARCMTLIERLEAGTQAQQTRATCIADPFAPACTDAIYGSAKTNRYTFCGSADALFANTADVTLCGLKGDGIAGTTIAGDICSWNGSDSTTTGTGTRINPLASICDVSDNVESRAYYCGVGGRRTADATKGACEATDINTADGCLANPFSAECTTNAGATITTALRMFLTEQRDTYCKNNVADKDFQDTLCQTEATDDNDFAKEVCASSGAKANPFEDFCVREGNDFADTRAMFVQNCKTVAGDSTSLVLDGSTACTAEINQCNTDDGYGAECVDEAAYSSLRQKVVAICEAGEQAAMDNANCANVNVIACLANPYLIRDEVKTNDVVTMAGLNCADNADYTPVRSTLLTACASGAAGDTATVDRCPFLVVNVCGEGTDVGTNPFDTRYCFAANNTFDVQRKALVDSCDGTSLENGCTAEINDCIANPFLANGFDAGVHCDDARFTAAFVDRTITYCGTGSTDAGVANISQTKCQTFAGTNPCVQNPFGESAPNTDCTNADLGGDDNNDALTAAQALRTTYCSTVSGTVADTTSAGIRADNTNSPICLGAVTNFCTDDNLFATASGVDMFNCATDTTYNADRETYATTTCSADAVTRGAGADCDLAIVEICTTTTGLQTNPWADACEGDTTAQRLAVVKECDDLANDNARNANPRCKRTGAANVRTTCIGDPRDAACNDYADGLEPFAAERLVRYVADCADADALTSGTDADFCPEANVKPLICVTNGPNARPFAPICGQNGADANLETYKDEVLEFCIANSTNAVDARCTDTTTAGTISSAMTMCGGFASGDTPFNPAAVITGFASPVACGTIDGFATARNNYATECRKGTASYNCVGVEGAIDLICETSTGSAANPFDTTICTTPDADAKLAFADLCDGKTAGVAISPTNAATCPQPVITCALNPFASGCTDDVAYNGRKTVVLTACQDSAIVADNSSNARCKTARAQVNCLADALGCTNTEAETQFRGLVPFASGADDDARSITYRNTIQANRVAYCAAGNNVNDRQKICRTTSQGNVLNGEKAFGLCLQNPFSSQCQVELGGSTAQSNIRKARVTHCRGLDATTVEVGTKTSTLNLSTVGLGEDGGLINLCHVAGDNSNNDAIGWICVGNDGTSASTTDKSRDPFSEICRAFPDIDARRFTRIKECAAADNLSTTTTPNDSTAFTTGTILSCNWTQQAALCSNDTSGLDAQCGTLNVPEKWATAATTITFRNSTGTANAFVDNFDNTGATPVTFDDDTLELHPDLPGGRSEGRISDLNLPNVRFYSARTKAVTEVMAQDAVVVTSDQIGDTVTTLEDGEITVTNSDVGKVITAEVIGVDAVDPGTARFFAGIEVNSGDVGRPFFNRVDSPTAVWNGNIDWVGIGNAGNATGVRAFKMLVNFNTRTLQGAVPITAGETTGDHLVIDAKYSGTGIISGTSGGGVTLRRYSDNPNTGATVNILAVGGANAFVPGKVSGLIGSEGAVGVFVNDNTNPSGYAGGFIVKPQ